MSQDYNPDSGSFEEKRKHERVLLELPVEYQIEDTRNAYGALVENGSEFGLRILSGKTIQVGTRLVVGVLFPEEYQLANFEVLAEVVWKDLYLETEREKFQYGLKFVEIREEDLEKLRKALSQCGAKAARRGGRRHEKV